MYTYYLPNISWYKIYALEEDWSRKKCQEYCVMIVSMVIFLLCFSKF